MKGNKNSLLKEEEVTRNFAFASVVSTNEIPKGKKFTTSNLSVMRPGNGDFKSSELKKLIGKVSTRIIKKKHTNKKMILNKKIIFVTSTRADFEKMKIFNKNIKKKKNFKIYIVVTGMHMMSNLEIHIERLKRRLENK